MLRKLIAIALAIISISTAIAAGTDSISSANISNMQWHMGAEASLGYVPGTNAFLRGYNLNLMRIRGSASGEMRVGCSFAANSRQGLLYKGLYQGIGVSANSFFTPSLLGSPTAVYVYQGVPIVHFTPRIWLGYEWKFGAAFGWKHHKEDIDDNNAVVSTSVTALMHLGVKLNYSLNDKWTVWLGGEGAHYSNGNTSWPNAGINSVGITVGAVYTFNQQKKPDIDIRNLERDADRGRWVYDIMAYGAWRKRAVSIGNPAMPELCPGKFGVLGLQLSPMRVLNRWVAVGPSLDLQWDEGAGLSPYWVEGTHDSYLKFERPPFGKRIKAGISAHAELTMPIFSINAGIGYDFINPKGDKRFYQSLSLKTFITRHLYLNIGYRLGDFKDPQNLMLGVGVRI